MVHVLRSEAVSYTSNAPAPGIALSSTTYRDDTNGSTDILVPFGFENVSSADCQLYGCNHLREAGETDEMEFAAL